MALNVEKIRNPQIAEFMTEHFNKVARLVYSGTPVVEDLDRIVTIANMKNTTTYTIAAQPDVPRNLTVTHATVAAGTDTLGTLLVTGKNIDGVVITETITPVADSLVLGTKAFKTVTSIIGTGWVINGGNDTILVGVGALIGLPVKLTATSQVLLGVLGTALVDPANVTVDLAYVEKNTYSLSAGTYNGSKKAFVFLVE